MLTSQQEIRWKKLTLWLTCKQKYYILCITGQHKRGGQDARY
ncbi:hypothetical protein WIS17_18550 (plasmid) [Clostridioides difficile]